MIRRHLRKAIVTALGDRPVVLLQGPRQSGKSTLVQAMATEDHPARYVTFDDATVLAAASADPIGFVRDLEGPVVLDEVQRLPELFVVLKAAVDRDRKPGRFLLTGSANVLLLPRLADSLAGRMEILTLWPLSQGELDGIEENFIDAVFGSRLPAMTSAKHDDLAARVIRGGYPEVIHFPAARRDAWFRSYIMALLERDVRNLANVEGLIEFPRLLSLVAARAPALANYAEISRSLAMPQTTLKRYLALLAAMFIVQVLPAWSTNASARLVRAGKIILVDTGLLAHLTGGSDLTGPLLENFVIMELRKQLGWSESRPEMFHFRTHTGHEVDIVLEDRVRRIVGIEVKAGATLGSEDFKGLRALAELAGKKFLRGIVLYRGQDALSFGQNLHALPISATWRLGHSR